MTTQISLSKPAPALKGFGTLTWMTFVKHVTNPFSLGFALGLPIMMYTMFGVGEEYSDVWLSGGNIASQILTSMTLYGVVVVESSLGTNVSLERVSGVSRLFAATPLKMSAQLLARIAAGMLMCLVVISVTFAYGYATGARMHPEVWLQVGAVLVASSILAAAMGLAAGFVARSEGAFALGSMVTVISAFLSGMFIPLDVMGSFFAKLAPYSPLYGVHQLSCAWIYDADIQWEWLVSAGLWTLAFALVAVFAMRRDTGR